ncbi:FAD-dependent oxidoreductase [Aquimarina sp. U1-2]|uniref:NAD(P)/FAD-dependent oxidoreductase n=1 Tax=Aquimarina sp. U1-2 TaxID=2823141 RepID=UPI001AECF38B|nr:NAD(P)/FAD-dependent oxidoreductase [Aquimarina sp. U1-2]MBP2831861.1 FAD-dependent oxidoreductase [Aquimarina sp. U1-2]
MGQSSPFPEGLRITRQNNHYEAYLDDDAKVCASTIVLANGITYRRLPVEGIEQFEGNGIYYSVTRLEARYCAGQNVVIMGGGNSAGQAAMFLSRHGHHTYIVVRKSGLSETMSSYLSTRIINDKRITLITDTEIESVHGTNTLEKLVLRNNKKEEKLTIDTTALFIMIGAVPNSKWLQGTLELDEKGFIKTGLQIDKASPYETWLPGVYAVGDIRCNSIKRVASAVGEGSVVVSYIHQYFAQRA